MNCKIVVTCYLGSYLYQVMILKGLLMFIERIISTLPLNILRTWSLENRPVNKKVFRDKDRLTELYRKLFTRPPFPANTTSKM